MKYINEGFKVALCLILVSAFGFIALALTTIWSDKATAQTKKTQAYYEKAQEATWAKYNNTDVLGFDVRQAIESTKDGKTGVIVTTERQLKKGLSGTGGRRISGFAYGGKVADGGISLDGKMIGYTISDLTITDGYITVNGVDAKNISIATDVTSCAYIPTNTKFHSTLLIDNVGNIIGVYFKEV